MKFSPRLSTAVIVFVIGIPLRASSEPESTLTRTNSTTSQSAPSPVYARSKSVPSNQRAPTRSKSVNLWKLDSVSRFPGMEDFFLLQRQRKKTEKALESMQATTTSTSEEADCRVKWLICKSIFRSSQYAAMSGENLMEPMDAKKEIKRYSPEIFASNFEKRLCMGPRGPWRRSHFVEKSTLRQVHVRGDVFPEMMFACLARKEGSQVFKQYYVSDDDYNVNEVPGGEYIRARFTFAPDANDDLIVHALAEEPADLPLLSVLELETLYLARRKRRSPTVEHKNDPVCRLDSAKKLRLCNALSSKFRIWYQLEVIAKLACEKRAVSFEHEQVEIRAPKKKLKEWMMTCLMLKEEEPPITYYVSRAYEDNEVFIFGAKLTLQYHARNVAVVSDHNFPDIPEEEEEEIT